MRLPPRAQPLGLALAEIGDPRHAAGEAMGCFLGISGDEVRNPEQLGDGLGDEAVGGGGDDDAIALLAMLGDQGARAGRDQWRDALRHKAFAQWLQTRAAVRHQRFEGEGAEVVDVQRAGLIGGIEALIARAIAVGIDQPLLGEVFPLEIVAVATKQGVVEIEDCKRHKNSVIPRQRW